MQPVKCLPQTYEIDPEFDTDLAYIYFLGYLKRTSACSKRFDKKNILSSLGGGYKLTKFFTATR